ncbi:MAG TPA: FMN-dependent NADH-azoreductase [Steroidobacter sp.]
MKTLLKIQASLYGANGASSRLAEEFAARWLENHPDGRVITRDLSAMPVPHLTAECFAAFGTPPEARTPEQRELVAYSDALIEELRAADEIVFAVPMYNFSVPSTLRAYFDHIARAGVTFRYTENGPEGLIKGKKAYVLLTRGGIYNGESDTQSPYLRQFLSFIGLTDLRFIYAQGLALPDREKSLEDARRSVASIVPPLVAVA